MITEAVASLQAHLWMVTEQHTALEHDSMVTENAELSERRAVSDDLVPRGTAIGRYIVVGVAGHGGMGVVYRGYDPELQREIALKLLRGPSRRHGAAEARLRREAQAMARISHPNVLPVYDVGTYDGHVWIAMEFLAADTLGDWLEAQRRTPAEIVAMFVQAGRGLAAAHAVGLIHRDFKPQNVLVGADGRPRVMDFGLARVDAADTDGGIDEPTPGFVGEHATQLTAAGSVVGTPRYMAPEQHYAKPMDARADQFSFCVALYEALYRVRAFGGDNLPDLALRKHTGEIEIGTDDGDVPAAVGKLLRRGMAGDPDDRFPSMDALLEALAPTIHGGGRRRPWLLLAVGGAAVVGTTGVALMLARERPCQDAQRKLAGVWDAARREEIRGAFEGTGVSYATDTVDRVEQQLDRYGHAWVEAHDAACAATKIHGEQSAALLDLRVACYDRLRGDLQALVDVFAQADPATVEKAVRAAHGLREIDECNASAELLSLAPAPSDEASRAEIAEIEAGIARARALGAAGKAHAAVEVLEPLVPRARALAHRPLEARTLEAWSDALGDDGQLERGREEAIAALAAALAGHATRTAAEVVLSLQFIEGYDLQHTAPSREWYRLGQSLVEALGGDERMSIALDNAEAIVCAIDGDFERSQRLFDDILGRLRAGAPDDPKLAVLVGNAGALMATRGQYPAARRYLDEALGLYRDRFGSDHPDLLRIEANLGAVDLFEGHVPESLARLQDVADRQERILGPEHPEFANTLNNLANALRQAGRPDEAIALHRRVLAIREHVQGSRSAAVAQTLDNLSIALRRKGELAESRSTHERAKAIREEVLPPDHPDRAASALSEAELCAAERNWVCAMPAFERALTLRRKILGPNHVMVVSTLSARADARIEQGDTKGAIDDLEQAVASGVAGGVSPRVVGLVRFQLAKLVGDPARARQLAEQAREAYAALEVHDRVAEIDAWLSAHASAAPRRSH
ncbi:MAG: tetratricopeptide repeat protein [Nannocystaceae bacterium]|nr:tetratricopeptide repeat protein [Nannocystaceae bacterium]